MPTTRFASSSKKAADPPPEEARTAKPSSMSKVSPKKARLRLRLYVAGDAPNSLAAVANINAICAEHFDYELEIVDLLAQPGRALTDGIIVTPTLLKLSPLPAHRMIGNLSDTRQVLLALGGQ